MTCKICKRNVKCEYVLDDQDGVALFCADCREDYGAEIVKTYYQDQKNDEAVECFACRRKIKADYATISGGRMIDMHDEDSKVYDVTWICDRCVDISEARYQESLLDVDRRESELAELDY